MKKTLFAFLIVLTSVSAHANDCVLLLHGMGRSAFSMKKIEKELKKEGYVVWNKSYKSTQKPIKDLALEHIPSGINYCNSRKTKSIHIVTHSLGGILIRFYLQNHAINNLGKIVMLSPPNKGSEITDLMKSWKLYLWATGPAGQELGTSPISTPNSLAPIEASIGIIAGRQSSDPWFSPLIPGDDDGKVSIESTKLEEMTDFLIVDSSHTSIMWDSLVIRQTIIFINLGKFEKNI